MTFAESASEEPALPVTTDEAPPDGETPSAPPGSAPQRSAVSRGDRLAPWIGGLAIALPALLARFPPMTDYPMHVGQVALLRFFHDPTRIPPGLYVLNLGHPNQLFHLTAAALAFVVGVDMSCKILLALIQAGILVAGGRLAAHLGVSRWAALLLAPIALGWMFFWGLVANLLGLAILLAALPSLDRAAERPTWRGAATSCGWMILLYAAHESVMVIACSALLVFTLGHPLRGHLRDAFVRFSPVLFAAAVFVLQLWAQSANFQSSQEKTPIVWHSLASKIRSLPTDLTGTLDPVSQWALFGLCIGAILIFAATRFQARSRQRRTVVEWIHHLRFELVALVNLVAFFVMPFGFDKGTMFHHRFYHPAYCLFALTVPVHLVKRPFKAFEKLLAGAVAAAVLLVGWPQFFTADEVARSLDQLLRQIEDGSAVTTIEADPKTEMRSFSTGTELSRVLVDHGGRVVYSLASSVIAPVRFDARYRWPKSEDRMMANTLNILPEVDLHLFRYVLIHSRDARLRFLVAITLEPEARFVDTVGEWTLMESRLPVLPPTSPEPPLPKPLPESLLDRLQSRSAAQKDMQQTDAPSDGQAAAPPTP